jgi:hypothetical protein
MNGTGERTTSDPVRVDVVHGGRTASAAVTVQRGDVPPSGHRAATARAWLALAEARAAAGDHPGAGDAASRGLEVLGGEYLDPSDDGVEDDTPTKLHAAASTDDERARATLRARVLEARLEMYGWCHEGLGLRFDPPVGGEGDD